VLLICSRNNGAQWGWCVDTRLEFVNNEIDILVLEGRAMGESSDAGN